MHRTVGEWLLTHADVPFSLQRCQADRALVIVETRPSFFLPHVVASAVRTHPGWRLYVFGTPQVHALLRLHCNNYDDATRVTLEDAGGMTTAEYSALLVSRLFWDTIEEEHVLVFQADCVLVRQTPPAMLAYDYVGAVCGNVDPEHFIMNGGLSLRRRSAMLRALSDIATDEPEDVAFCKTMRAVGGFNLPSLRTCDAFAIESRGNPDTAVGMHGTDKWYAPPALIGRMLDGCVQNIT